MGMPARGRCTRSTGSDHARHRERGAKGGARSGFRRGRKAARERHGHQSFRTLRALSRENFDDGWESEKEEAAVREESFRTEVTIERARTIISPQ